MAVDKSRTPGAGRSSNQEAAVKKIVALLKTTGGDFSGYKRSTLLRRFERRMSLRRIEDFASYAACLESDPSELKSLSDEILIHVTAFFREPAAFDAVKTAVFESLVKSRKPDTPIRLWVPGCSTGEEVYSLLIALLDYLEEKGLSFPIQVFGTDVSERVVALARQGRYSEPEVSPQQRRRYFTAAQNGQYQISKAVRELCVFAQHDLTRDPPYSNLDFVSCRNVLIYFDQSLQEKIIPIFHYALAPSGFLLLGPSESIDSFDELFTPVEKAHRIFTKTGAPGRLPVNIFHATRPIGNALEPPRKESSEKDTWSAVELANEADRIVLAAAAPSVIISENLEVIQTRGDLRPFLTISTTDKPGFNLAKAAHEGLLSPVTQAVEQAKKRRVPIVVGKVDIRKHDEKRTVQLQIIPLPAPAAGQSHFLILFADPAAPPPAGCETLEDSAPETRERYLERELRATRLSLEAVIAKQQSTNEDLQSINEELRSRNEEYHSSLEELQTTHEELQSSSEEMATLNDELRKRTTELDEKNAQLKSANEELRSAIVVKNRFASIVESSDDAIVGKTLGGVIESWNYGAEQLFGYSAKETIGRSIEMLIPPGRPNEEPSILERIRRGERIAHYETVRRRKDGSLIDVSVTISPIKDAEGKIIGASKIARDITEKKKEDERLERQVEERTTELRTINEELEAFSSAVAHDLRAPLRRINAFAQIIQEKLKLKRGSPLQQDFQRIIGNTKGMSELINGLLNLSRLTRHVLSPKPVDLSEMASQIAKDLQKAGSRKGVTFVVAPGVRAHGDSDLLRALLQNLLENSWKFTSKHLKAKIEFGIAKVDGSSVFFVRDDGAGFDATQADKLFTAFQRLHHADDFPGTGIGLATAKRIVTRHGGRLWCEGAVEKGAVFYFTLGDRSAH